MLQTPIRFVCESCGLDASDFVNDLIRQELATVAPPPPAAAAPPPAVAAPAPAAPRLSIARPAQPASAPVAAADPGATPTCVKHGQPAMEHCLMCNKPICPGCMELFGYVCSPFCKARATSNGIEIPVYALQKSVVEARLWRKVGLISTMVVAVVAITLGLWFWYAWFGSRPREVFAVRFPEAVHSGQSAFTGGDQLVFLRGGTLARYDTKSEKEIWSQYLLDKKQIDDRVNREIKEIQSMIDHANANASDFVLRLRSANASAGKNVRRGGAGDGRGVASSGARLEYLGYRTSPTGSPRLEYWPVQPTDSRGRHRAHDGVRR
jgi:hypothetical protein